MRNFKSKLALPLVGAALSFGSVQMANAGALATSVVEFTNFEIYRTDGFSYLTQVDATDLGSLSFTNSADVNASIDGSPGACSGGVCSGGGTPLDLFRAAGADTSTATGTGIYDDNDFTHLSSTSGLPVGGGNFAIADTEELGFPLTGLGTPTHADVSTGSYVSLEGQGVGSSQSNNELTASFLFSALSTDFLLFEFDLSTFVEAFLTSDGMVPSKASAGWDIVMTLENLSSGGFLLDFGLTCSVSRTAPFGANDIPTNGGSGDCGASGTDLQALTSSAMTVGDAYEFTASIQTRADATFVPAPGALALMGLGLVGLAGFSRRKA